MKGLLETVSSVNKKMSELEAEREIALSMSRSIVRKTKNMIHAIHTGGEFMTMQGALKEEMKTLQTKLKNAPYALYSNAVEDCMSEFAEAMILSAIVRKKDIPSFETLKISPQSWAMGLSDVIGELRRLVLTSLMAGDMKKAQYYFGNMEDIGNEVMSFDILDAIAPIRRKQDMARGVLERTRSDMTTAVIMTSNRE